MSRESMNLEDAVDDVAPPPPPCFFNDMEWREYLKSAAAVQNQRGEPVVILLDARRAPVFNADFDFCTDCKPEFRFAAREKGLCKPKFFHNYESTSMATTHLQGVIETIRLVISTIGPATARDIERHPEVVKACRSSKTKARRHIERLQTMGHIVSDGERQMPKFSVKE